MYVCFFCVFKQKTAYELRISDWSSDVCSSDLIGVRHDDDLVIAGLGDVEFLGADVRAEGRDQRADLRRAQHLVEARALDIQDLAPQRQDSLRDRKSTRLNSSH